MARVLIVTRTKDRALLLERALNSVAEQNYDDYEHLVFNNGGDRESVDSLIGKLKPVNTKVLHSDTTVSRAEALNRCITSSKSKYIAVLDDDDTWHPNYLSQMTNKLEAEDIQGVVCRIDQVVERIKGDKVDVIKRSIWMKDLRVVSLYQQCIDNQLSTVGFMYSRDAYNSLGGYSEDLNVLEDYEYGIRFLLKYDVEFLDPGYSLANYHKRVSSRGRPVDNSFVNEDHRYNFYKIANRFLRQELQEGRLGVGYIMSSIKYEQTYMYQAVRRVMPRFLASVLKRRIQD